MVKSYEIWWLVRKSEEKWSTVTDLFTIPGKMWEKCLFVFSHNAWAIHKSYNTINSYSLQKYTTFKYTIHPLTKTAAIDPSMRQPIFPLIYGQIKNDNVQYPVISESVSWSQCYGCGTELPVHKSHGIGHRLDPSGVLHSTEDMHVSLLVGCIIQSVGAMGFRNKGLLVQWVVRSMDRGLSDQRAKPDILTMCLLRPISCVRLF